MIHRHSVLPTCVMRSFPSWCLPVCLQGKVRIEVSSPDW